MHTWGDWSLVGCFNPYMEIEVVDYMFIMMGFDPCMQIEEVDYMFIMMGFDLVQIGSVAMILDMGSGAR